MCFCNPFSVLHEIRGLDSIICGCMACAYLLHQNDQDHYAKTLSIGSWACFQWNWLEIACDQSHVGFPISSKRAEHPMPFSSTKYNKPQAKIIEANIFFLLKILMSMSSIDGRYYINKLRNFIRKKTLCRPSEWTVSGQQAPDRNFAWQTVLPWHDIKPWVASSRPSSPSVLAPHCVRGQHGLSAVEWSGWQSPSRQSYDWKRTKQQ